MKSEILRKLNSKNHQIAKDGLKSIIKRAAQKDAELLEILNLSNKLIVNDFLYLQPKFSYSNFLVLEKYINENLNHKNKLFVSDLIECATDFNLSINYDKCIKLLKKHNADNYYVLISAMEYLFFNLKMNYISEISDSFKLILKDKNIDSSAKIRSAFYLYRITFKPLYLTKLKQLIGNDSYNKEVLKNLMKVEINNKEYFEGHLEILSFI